MADAADWRSQIIKLTGEIWPALPNGPRLIEGQCQVESRGDPRALSPAGAQGLLQLMPRTAQELGVQDAFDPIQNLRGGITYLRRQYERLPEIPEPTERLRYALAAYNGGLGYVLKALHLAELDSLADWHQWQHGRYWLMHRNCQVGGKWPIYKQIFGYVDRVMSEYRKRGG